MADFGGQRPDNCNTWIKHCGVKVRKVQFTKNMKVSSISRKSVSNEEQKWCRYPYQYDQHLHLNWNSKTNQRRKPYYQFYSYVTNTNHIENRLSSSHNPTWKYILWIQKVTVVTVQKWNIWERKLDTEKIYISTQVYKKVYIFYNKHSLTAIIMTCQVTGVATVQPYSSTLTISARRQTLVNHSFRCEQINRKFHQSAFLKF